ncbi:uncharacterized protein involved in exopolysaccharide biosynthesis [Duganella sp. 3397]|uniref:GumC family protein n=1 Tax=Duganella sp. 3397 TaxID=2817732 RepID=UPI00285ADE23|nr:Wzz/FepE/Etk N-terminal domain-containing protein [Duganella sp. 3397]MDR7052273.1 uncharacterized protein involved in exopolysaccharide biosynthesis [Duganella sp. 3397]
MEFDKNGVLEENASLISVFTILARQKAFVIGMPFVTGLVAIAASLIMTPIFTSTTVIMPPQQQGSSTAAAILGQLGGIGGAALGTVKNPSDLYVGMLKSRTIADQLINEFKLKERYNIDTIDAARKRLELASTFLNGKDGLIAISVDDADPEVATNIANAYVKKLQLLTGSLAIGEASRRRKFFGTRVLEAKNDLANAEVAFRKIQESTGMVELSGQVKGLIASSAQLQGEIASKQVQLSSIMSYATKNNPEVLRLEEEIRAMTRQLARLTKGADGSGMTIATGKLPQVGSEYIRGVRDVKYYEATFEMLSKQFELARVDEANNDSAIQILDVAVPPEKKSRPVRAPMVALGVLGGIILGLAFAFMRDAYTRSMRTPEGQLRWTELTAAWRGEK